MRAHIFLCTLAWYVEWHMREAWRPLLFGDTELEEDFRTRDPVATAERSERAQRKASRATLDDGTPVHCFRTLIETLEAMTSNQCRIRIPGHDAAAATFEVTTRANETQQRASISSTRSGTCHNRHPDCRQKGENRIRQNRLQNNTLGPYQASNFSLGCAAPPWSCRGLRSSSRDSARGHVVPARPARLIETAGPQGDAGDRPARAIRGCREGSPPYHSGPFWRESGLPPVRSPRRSLTKSVKLPVAGGGA